MRYKYITSLQTAVLRKLASCILVVCGLLPMHVYGLGLGDIEITSGLNEPFAARIKLFYSIDEDLSQVDIGLASHAAFKRSGLNWSVELSKLEFTKTKSGEYIKITSEKPIREPFLNFLVEVNWAHGHLFREYTALLDPPIYEPKATAVKRVTPAQDIASAQGISEAGSEQTDPTSTVIYTENFDAFNNNNNTLNAAQVATTYGRLQSGDTYEVTAGESLWSIANGLLADTGLNINQIMLAIYRANLDGFYEDNINALRKGSILTIPDISDMEVISRSAAISQAIDHHTRWGAYTALPVAAVGQGVDVTPLHSVQGSQQIADAELRLLAVGDGSSTNVGSGAQSELTLDGSTITVAQLVLAEESLHAVTQENADLKNRLQQVEDIIGDQQKLIDIQNNELTLLKNLLRESAVDLPADPAVDDGVDVITDPAMSDEQNFDLEPEESTEDTSSDAALPQTIDIDTEMELDTNGDMQTAELADEVFPEDESDEFAGMASEVEEDEFMFAEELPGSDDFEAEINNDDVPTVAGEGILGMLNKHLASLWVVVKDLGQQFGLYIIAGLLCIFGVLFGMKKLSAKLSSRAIAKADTNADTSMEPDFGVTGFGSAMDGADVSEIEPAKITGSDAAEAFDVGAEDVDEPLQEVNTYIAFKQYAEAEEFVRKAIKKEPQNPAYHMRLLEVFYTSGNKKSFEESAKVLHGIVGGGGDYWEIAELMWSEMSPNRGIFEAAAEGESDMVESSGDIVDLTSASEAEEVPASEIFDITEVDSNNPLSDKATVGSNIEMASAGSEDDEFESTIAIPDMDNTEIVDDEVEGLDAPELMSNEKEKNDLDLSLNMDAPDTISSDDLDFSITTDALDDALDSTALLSELDEMEFDTTFDLSKNTEKRLQLSTDDADLSMMEQVAANVEEDGLDMSIDMSELELGTNVEEELQSYADLSMMEQPAANIEEDGLDMSIDMSELELDADAEKELQSSEDADLSMMEQSATNVEKDGLEMPIDMSEIEPDADAEKGLQSSEDADLSMMEQTIKMPNLPANVEENGLEMSIDMPELDPGADVEEELQSSEDADLSMMEQTIKMPNLQANVEEGGLEMSVDMPEPAPSADVEEDTDDQGIAEDSVDIKLGQSDASGSEDVLSLDSSMEVENVSEDDLEETMEMVKLDDVKQDGEAQGDKTQILMPGSNINEGSGSKLDLAQAYFELGDKESAKSSLVEVIESEDSTPEQRQHAENLMSQI